MVPKRKKQKRGFPIKNFGNDKKGVISECLYPLFRHPGNLRAGVHKYLKAYGCLIKALRHDERGRFPIKNFGHDGRRKTFDGRLYIFFPSLGVRVIFLPLYKANYIGLKTRDRHARQDTPCSR